MKTCIFTGSAVAIVTPFKRDAAQSIDYEKLAQLIELQINGGTQALIVAGTTGEASTMPDQEHIELIARSVELVKGRLPLIAGVGSNDTAHAVSLAREAEKVGANALLCVTPYYNKASQEGLYRHFAKTAEAVSLPIILYNVPSRTNCNIDPQTYQRLSAYENIVASKECNLSQLAEAIDLCGDQLAFYSGEDALVVPLMALGGLGVISVAANVAPQRLSELTQACLDMNFALAGRLQAALAKLVKALFCDINPMPVKEAMNQMGLDVGECRLPLCEISEDKKAYLRGVLAAYGLL